LGKQELPRFVRQSKYEPLSRAFVDPLLNRCHFKIEDRAQFSLFQAAEHYNLVYPIHELGRELLARGIKCRAVNLLIEVVINETRTPRRRKTDRAGDQLAHLPGAKV